MSQKHNVKRAKLIEPAGLKDSELDGIVEINTEEELDVVVGGSPYGPPNTPPPPPTPIPPPTTYPGQPPIPNFPSFGPFPSR